MIPLSHWTICLCVSKHDLVVGHSKGYLVRAGKYCFMGFVSNTYGLERTRIPGLRRGKCID